MVLTATDMEPEGIKEENIVNVDYSLYDTATQTIQPTVYIDGEQYCCLSGLDPQSGVLGCGATPHEAILDWRDALAKETDHEGEADE